MRRGKSSFVLMGVLIIRKRWHLLDWKRGTRENKRCAIWELKWVVIKMGRGTSYKGKEALVKVKGAPLKFEQGNYQR